MNVQRWRSAAVIALGLGIWAFPGPSGIDARAWPLFAIFVSTIAALIVRPVPMGAVALVAIGVALLTRTLNITEVLSGFMNVTLWLVMAAFFLATGFVKTGLGTRIAYWLVALFGRSTLGLGYSLILTDLILAPAIASSTARAGGVIFPILQALTGMAKTRDARTGASTSAYLTLTVYQGTVVTSAMFLTSTVVNPLIAQLAAGQGVSMTWTTWALAGIVPGLASLIVVPPMVYRLCPPGVTRTPDAPVQARHALGALGPMTRAEWTMSVVAVLLIGAWIFGAAIALDATAAALIALATLVVTGVLGWDDITGAREAWDLLFWFGALVMMAGYMTQFGLVAWFTSQVGGTFVGVGWMWGVVGLSLIYFYTHYFFVSNTAHVSAMFAPFLAIAIALGAPPLPAALLLGAFSSIDACLTHYGTPSGPILFASGQVPIGAWWRTGAVLSVVHIVIWLSAGPLWWRLVGLW